MRLYSSYPSIDLHGFDREFAVFKTKEFLYDNQKLKNYNVIIVHGVGTGILKRCIHEYLEHERIVSTYKLDNFNSGCTLVTIKEKH